MNNCGNCDYGRWCAGIVQCHRHAPTRNNGEFSAFRGRPEWPEMEKTDWCGDWAEENNEAADSRKTLTT